MLTGNTLPGRSRAAVAVELAKVMRIPEARALELLSGKEKIVKRDLDVALLGRYHHALRGAGAETRAREVTEEEEFAAQGGTVPMHPADSDGPLGGKNVSDMTDKELDALIRALEAPMEIPGGKVECPCCRMIALKQRSVGEECAVCGWRDYQGQNEYHLDNVVPGRNFDLSLKQAREEFEVYGDLDPRHYTPNEVPLRTRVTETLVTLFVVAYCSYSLWANSLFVPGINRYSPAKAQSFTLHGIEAWLISASLLFGVLQFFISVLDHYDKRRNEVRYRKIAYACRVLMFVFFGLWMAALIYRDSGGDTRALAVLVVVGLILAVMAIMAHKNPRKY